MRILISGICGFVASAIAEKLSADAFADSIVGIDNLARRGSWQNLPRLESLGIEVVHGDVRCASDLEAMGPVDWVIDAAATPSVLSGISAGSTSRQSVETNLVGTINLLEFCKQHGAGLVLLSSSRVYSIPEMAAVPLKVERDAFTIDASGKLPVGVSDRGISERFPTTAPISLYGATKLASEILAQEYSFAFGIRLWINRCGVLAGAGQFGKADQGIFAFWLHSWREKAKLRYIGFGGTGHQVRDCLHPYDLANLIEKQLSSTTGRDKPTIVNVSGGRDSTFSLAQLSAWCQRRWGPHTVDGTSDPRPYDLPWVALDHSLASEAWDWQPEITTEQILSEIAEHAENNPQWLELSS